MLNWIKYFVFELRVKRRGSPEPVTCKAWLSSGTEEASSVERN